MTGPDGLSYAVRPTPEQPWEVWASRIGGTGALFSVAIGISVLLGRRR